MKESLSITSWNRIEPKQRSSNYELALQARIHDPLWMLARQWQIGEFEGEDAASPVKAEIDATFVQLDSLAAKSSSGVLDYNPESIPLEVAVEQEKKSLSGLDQRLRAELGNEFFKFIAAGGLPEPDRGKLINSAGFPSQDDASKHPYLKKSIDAATLMGLEVLQVSETFDNLSNTQKQSLEKAFSEWKDWANEAIFGSEHDGAWNPERQEFAFSVASHGLDENSDEITLAVNQYRGGHLDWPAFSVESDILTGTSPKPPANEINLELIPMPVEIAGMPSQRWWEFDDNNVDFGTLETAPQDIGRMLLAQFALISGNNWFSIPMELPIGSLAKIQRLEITNTFGETLTASHSSVQGNDNGTESGKSPWRMFHISTATEQHVQNNEPFLFLPPALGPYLHSESIEEVRFMRDEMVNAAWLIEHIVQDKTTGSTINRHEKYHNRQPGFDAENTGNGDATMLKYSLATDVPDYWFPLLPVQNEQGQPSNKLHLGTLLRHPDQQQTTYMGALSNELNNNAIFDEELPREGIYVYRQYQFARWHDGSSYLWISRRKIVGTGEGSSNLKFDTATR
ncbi:MAG: hypothetical protein JJU41_03370 [Bacteroidetes bacterium]|nr:hypothetical protein [Bacteroidota bacterium]MCH8524712.1 hypothetical protein [Balneolales bacterium]